MGLDTHLSKQINLFDVIHMSSPMGYIITEENKYLEILVMLVFVITFNPTKSWEKANLLARFYPFWPDP